MTPSKPPAYPNKISVKNEAAVAAAAHLDIVGPFSVGSKPSQQLLGDSSIRIEDHNQLNENQNQ